MRANFNFSGLSEPVAKKLAKYLEGLSALIGGDLNSVVLYGSAASEDFDPKRSNINLLVVVEKLDFGLLHKIQPFVSRWARHGIVAPLFLTHEHMHTSSDVFPLEFLDMSDFHKTIWGEDPFEKLQIGRENLRLECEEKLKGSLINLRQSYLEIADRRLPMMRLVASSITGVVSIFRGLIRLAGKKAPLLRREVVDLAATLHPIDAKVFHRALEIKHLAPHMTRLQMDAFFASYLEEIEKLAIHVDRMGRKPKTRPVAKSKGRNLRGSAKGKKK